MKHNNTTGHLSDGVKYVLKNPWCFQGQEFQSPSRCLTNNVWNRVIFSLVFLNEIPHGTSGSCTILSAPSLYLLYAAETNNTLVSVRYICSRKVREITKENSRIYSASFLQLRGAFHAHPTSSGHFRSSLLLHGCLIERKSWYIFLQ